MKTYMVNLYNTISKKRVSRELKASTLLEAWQLATGYCHGTHWIVKGIVG